MTKKPTPTRQDALKVARYLGCRGAHQRPDGMWVPCADDETLQRLSSAAEPKEKARKKKPKDWENLTERGVISIQTLPGGGLVSGKSLSMTLARLRIDEQKAMITARTVRPTDPDVFTNDASARVRSRQLGCIGIRRYQGTNGEPVWMPCTNESDYRRATGTSPQGKRDRERREREMERRIERRLRKKALNDRQEELYDDLEASVEEYGMFDKGVGADGAHYMPESKNPFIKEGLVCSNCVFWMGPKACEIVKGDIEPNAICKLWIIDEKRLSKKSADFVDSKQVQVRKPRSDRLSATPAPKTDRVFGSRKNPEDSAAKPNASIELDDATVRSLTSKMREHNKRMREENKPDWSIATLGQLKTVYRRGAGAFSVSHRPGMTRGQWAIARVNAFLKMLDKGKPDKATYTTDSDLLRDSHPWKRTSKTLEVNEKALRSVRFDPNAQDGDGDGMVQDNTRFRRPAKPNVGRRLPFGGTGRRINPLGQRLSAGAAQPRNEAVRPRKFKYRDPSFISELGYRRPQRMLDKPGDTKSAFGRGGRRYSDSRYAVHQLITSALTGKTRKTRPGEQKTMHVIGGTSGSYKSSMRREGFQGIPDRDNAVHIDPDEVKEMLPEYPGWVDEGRSDAATLVHEESRDVVEMAFQEALRQDKNIVYDTSGQFNNGFATLRQARERGYKIIAHYTTGDIETFIAGVEERRKATGRGVPEYIIRNIANNLPGITRAINRRGLFDEFYLWDTTQSGKRVLVAKKVGDGSLEILDKKLWQRYLNGGS